MKRGLFQIALVAAVGLMALLAFALARVQASTPGEPAPSVVAEAPLAGPDLTAEIALVPSGPAVGQQATIQVTVRNRGTSGSGNGFFVYLYVNPADRPPVGTTSPSYFWQLPSMPAGGSSLLQRNVTFTTAGCDHMIYVWVDKEGAVADADPANNLVALQVCVGVTCEADAYESDDTCAAAGWSSSGAVQDRTLCPVGDEDWIKFTAVAGITYTVAATDLGMHANPLLSLYQGCGGLSQFGTGPSFQWFAPASGVYYIHVRHHDDNYGPLANYRLGITAGPGSGDAYEPDDTCATARDIPTNDTPQMHLFQGPGDQDWIKFSVAVGDNFTVIADQTATGVSPQISVYSSCSQTASPALADGRGSLTASAIPAPHVAIAPQQTTQTYYARVVNANAEVYGPEAHYRLRVQDIPCAADIYEDDDTSATAGDISTSGVAQTHNTCPAGDTDWVRFSAEAGSTYVLHTSNLGIAADTYLYLYGTDGTTELAKNDDYGYLLSSRIIWQAPQDGIYYAMVRHHNPMASGVDTRYDLAIDKGSGCSADAFEPDNGLLDAQTITAGTTQNHTFCAGADLADVGDQDWVRFEAAAGADYLIQTANLGPQSDTVLEVYDRNMVTLLASNDDAGLGEASSLDFVAPATGTYFLRVRHFDAGQTGDGTEYELSITGEPPPTPTPTATPTASPTPSPTPTPAPHSHHTLILVNSQRTATLYGQAAADALLAKLYTLADHERVQGAVIDVQSDAAVASAYATWTAGPESLVDTANANAVAGAVRNLAFTFLANGPNVEYVVLAGGDQIFPHRRLPEGAVSVAEQTYAGQVSNGTTLWGAVNANMTLTDDYYVDQEPTIWQGRELYIPDYAIGRLVETPAEIMSQIDLFLANPVLNGNRALVTGYDFVFDAATGIGLLVKNDGFTSVSELIGQSWSGADQRTRMVNTIPRYDVQSINTHADHQSFGAPDNDKLTADQIIGGTSDLSRAIVFSVGCHAGFNDSGSLDLAQAYAQKGAIFVGNTGYGWGGNGVVYSEKLMKNFAYNLLNGTTSRTGKALAAAKKKYYQTESLNFGPYDEKVMMQAVFYGLPMYELTSSASLEEENPFPSVQVTPVPPAAFGPVAIGGIDLGLAGSFGAFDEHPSDDGSYFGINTDNISFDAGAPVQPRFYATLSSAQAGELHGALFLGGVYTDVVGFNPVIARPHNEYVTTTEEPTFGAAGWYPSVPFQVRTNDSISSTTGSLVSLLGQFNSATNTQRLYDQMSFATYFSDSPDVDPPEITHVAGIMGPGANQGSLKVEANDPSGVLRVVAAYTDGSGTWYSQDLTYSDVMQKWTGAINATQQTHYFVQVVDGAGNTAVDDKKGAFYDFPSPVSLAPGASPSRLYLPLTLKGE